MYTLGGSWILNYSIQITRCPNPEKTNIPCSKTCSVLWAVCLSRAHAVIHPRLTRQRTSPTSTLSPMSRHSTIRATLFGSSASQVTSQPTLWADRCKLEDISSLHSPALGKYRTRPSHQITKRIKEQIHSHCSTIIHVNHGGCSSGCQPACEVEEHRPRIEVCIMSKRGTAASEHDLT